MSVLSVRLPESLHKMAKDVAEEDNVSLNQFIATAVAEKVAALTTENYLKSRADRGKHSIRRLPKCQRFSPKNLTGRVEPKRGW